MPESPRVEAAAMAARRKAPGGVLFTEREARDVSRQPSAMWAKTARARIAHLYTVCEVCEGRGWLIGETYGPFGLAIEPEPCVKCGGSEGDYDSFPYGGRGFNVACGYWSYSDAAIEPAPDAERCRRCSEAA